MTTPAHALSAGLIAATAVGAAPTDTRILLLAVAAGAVADLDHLLPVARGWPYYREHGFRGNLHNARTPVHEVPGLIGAGAISVLLWPFTPDAAAVLFIAFVVHLAQDFVTGRSRPFDPVDRTVVQMFAVSHRTKVAVDLVTIVASALLWLLFLKGRL